MNTKSSKKPFNRVKVNLSGFLIETRLTPHELAKKTNIPYSTIHSYIRTGVISIKSLRVIEASFNDLSKYLNK